jgi:hypothetical protein
MATAIMEAQFRDALNGDRDLAARGCVGVPRQPSGIAVERRGIAVGVWHWRNGRFEFAPATSSDPPIGVDTVAEAVRHTRERLCPP